jgi:ribosomal protein S18 acetylase RimI-like enzyme
LRSLLRYATLSYVRLLIRPLSTSDIEPVVELSLRAWEPVHDSMAKVLGAEIFQCLYGFDWRRHQERDVRRACADYLVWVAEADGRVVGFTAINLPEYGIKGEIQMLAVDPEYQGRGIGLELTNFGVERLREAGKKIAVVGTGGDPGHAPARATYEKAGFTGLPLERYYRTL